MINIFVIFQRIINNQLYKYLDIFVIVYLNNILVFFKNKTKYIKYIKKVFKKLKKAKLLLRPKKYKFYKNKIRFLGFIVEKNKIKIDKE